MIYVVEDDEGMQEVYEGAFEENYQTRIFSSGADFFEAFNAQKPDLIILDIMLPEMDGFRLISEIRESLRGGEKITVISTSLIEAGVDLDFRAVYREIAGIDSILQSAGRCNREGKKDNCFTYIFIFNIYF